MPFLHIRFLRFIRFLRLSASVCHSPSEIAGLKVREHAIKMTNVGKRVASDISVCPITRCRT